MVIKGKAKRYDKKFKLGVVKLVTEEGKSTYEVAKSLGVSEAGVRGWVAKARVQKDDAFPGSGNQTPGDSEVSKLKEELRITRMERDILKKPTAYLAERPK